MLRRISHGAVLELLLDCPPVNALSVQLRSELAAAIAHAQEDATISAIIIRGSGKMFSGGADITEFDAAPLKPGLPQLVGQIEASEKPVIAAIHGSALGGGLETALGCHYRIATSSAELGLPEIKLGVLPAAGGTQRLPRLVGLQASLDMILSGKPISAAKAAEIGLVDKVVAENDLEAAALDFARTAPPVRRTGERTVAPDPALFEAFRGNNERLIRGRDAAEACIAAITAATDRPLEDGLALEVRLFLQLVEGKQSRALRHAFFAERAANKIDGLPAGTTARPVTTVGIIGAGTMGGGIAMNFLTIGVPVTIVETSKQALDHGVSTIRRNYLASAAKGRMSEEQVEAAMALLSATLDFTALAESDLIIEAVYENMALKQDIFRRLDKTAKAGAILASNTSALDIDAIAAVTGRPQDVIGLHFFSPANIMKLVEVVRGRETGPDVLATAMQVIRRIGKTGVVCGVCYGFIGNRMLVFRQREAEKLLIEGADLDRIDKVHTDFGMPMGPFQMIDLAGNDIGWHRDPIRIETLQDALCAAGRLGQKTKAGYYDYDDQRKRSLSPETARIVAQFRTRSGTGSREISDEEIVARTLFTMVNEGHKILEEGIAQRKSDIDVVWMTGYGWPQITGGPMYWADQLGLDVLGRQLRKVQHLLDADFVFAKALGG
jgi:3-hydroxyacyl-CoA dehydrogenase